MGFIEEIQKEVLAGHLFLSLDNTEVKAKTLHPEGGYWESRKGRTESRILLFPKFFLIPLNDYF